MIFLSKKANFSEHIYDFFCVKIKFFTKTSLFHFLKE